MLNYLMIKALRIRINTPINLFSSKGYAPAPPYFGEPHVLFRRFNLLQCIRHPLVAICDEPLSR